MNKPTEKIIEATASLTAHFKEMQRLAAMWLEPSDYVAKFPKENNAFNTVFGMPEPLHSESARAAITGRRDKAFLSDIIRMLDGPEERSALTAALAVEAGAVGVKPLEWNPYRAETPFGWYEINDQRGVPESELKGRLPFLLCGSRLDYSRHASLQAARDAAQADYEARIRSALTPASSAVEGEAVAEPKFGRLFRSKTPLEVDRDPVHRRVQRELKPLRDAIIKGSSPAPTPAGDDLQAAVVRWADALHKCETENTRAAGHALDEAEEALLSFASPAPHQEGRADGRA